MKPNLFIRGNLLSDSYLSTIGGGNIYFRVSEEDCDLSSAIIIDGDVRVPNIAAYGLVAVTGKAEGGVG